jgi:hypothetical protein
VNIAFFGATPALRPARLQPSPLAPDRQEVAYRDAQADPIFFRDPQLATANTWDGPPLDKPAAQIVGNTYGGYGINDPMVIVEPSAWPFVGTGLANGSELAHVIAGDYDHYDPAQPNPPGVEVLAQSPVYTSYGKHDQANMIYYSDQASGAGVLATGTIGWIGSLTPCPAGSPDPCPAPAVQQITANVLKLFGAGPAGRTQPSVPNWRRYR